MENINDEIKKVQDELTLWKEGFGTDGKRLQREGYTKNPLFDVIAEAQLRTLNSVKMLIDNKIDFVFTSINSYIELMLDEDFNKEDVENCVYEYGNELKDKIIGKDTS